MGVQNTDTGGKKNKQKRGKSLPIPETRGQGTSRSAELGSVGGGGKKLAGVSLGAGSSSSLLSEKASSSLNTLSKSSNKLGKSCLNHGL